MLTLQGLRRWSEEGMRGIVCNGRGKRSEGVRGRGERSEGVRRREE